MSFRHDYADIIVSLARPCVALLQLDPGAMHQVDDRVLRREDLYEHLAIRGGSYFDSLNSFYAFDNVVSIVIVQTCIFSILKTSPHALTMKLNEEL